MAIFPPCASTQGPSGYTPEPFAPLNTPLYMAGAAEEL